MLILCMLIGTISVHAAEKKYYASDDLRIRRAGTPYIISEILPINDSIVKVVFRNMRQGETTMYFRLGQTFWVQKIKGDGNVLDDIYSFEFDRDPMVSSEGIRYFKIIVKSFDYNKIVVDEEMLPLY